MKTIHPKNLPVKAPVTQCIVIWLLLDRFDVGGVAWGVFYTLAAILWALWAVLHYSQEFQDVFKKGM